MAASHSIVDSLIWELLPLKQKLYNTLGGLCYDNLLWTKIHSYHNYGSEKGRQQWSSVIVTRISSPNKIQNQRSHNIPKSYWTPLQRVYSCFKPPSNEMVCFSMSSHAWRTLTFYSQCFEKAHAKGSANIKVLLPHGEDVQDVIVGFDTFSILTGASGGQL